jgi:hypothetical protein
MSVRRPRGETGILRGLGGPSGEGSGKDKGWGEEGFIGEDLGFRCLIAYHPKLLDSSQRFQIKNQGG